MNRRGWFIPIIVFVVSLVFLFSYQNRQDVVSFADTTSLPPLLWSEASANITDMTYTGAGKTIKVHREGDDWFLPDSNSRKADSLYIHQNMSPFLEPLFENTVEVSPSTLTKYGIMEPYTSITLVTNDGKEHIIVKGSVSEDGRTYVYVPLTDTIYTMNNAAFETFSTDLNAWSSKDLLVFDLDNVKKIDLTYKGHSAQLLPKVTDERLTFTSNELDDRLVEEFLSFLHASKIQNFLAEEASDHVLSVYGFSNPLLKCTITLKSGETLSLTIGSVNETENICYAKVNGSSDIVGIPYFNLSQFNMLYSELQESSDDSSNKG